MFKVKEGIAMEIRIRLATPKDAKTMGEIHHHSWEKAYENLMSSDYIRQKFPTTMELYQKTLFENNDTQYVLEYNEIPVGIMCVDLPYGEEKDTTILELHRLYIHPDYWHMGIGTIAINFAFNKAKNSGIKKMIVWVFENNNIAVKFYEAFGFYQDGLCKEYLCRTVNQVCVRMTVDFCS